MCPDNLAFHGILCDLEKPYSLGKKNDINEEKEAEKSSYNE